MVVVSNAFDNARFRIQEEINMGYMFVDTCILTQLIIAALSSLN